MVGAVGLAIYWLMRALRIRGAAAGVADRVSAGFSGWLVVLVAAQCFAVLSLAGGLLRHLPLFERYAAMPATRPAVFVEVGIHVAVLAFVAWATVMMLKRRRLFTTLLHVELLLLVTLPTLKLAGAVSETTYVTEPKAWLGVLATFGLSAIVAITGFAYSLYSTRFRSAFVR